MFLFLCKNRRYLELAGKVAETVNKVTETLMPIKMQQLLLVSLRESKHHGVRRIAWIGLNTVFRPKYLQKDRSCHVIHDDTALHPTPTYYK